ncbi:hypothetical protein ACFPJ1_40440 [Kribbella qitaiheensis]|uniref:hypothetical protein n=1 Tax=Kribbella qitaiheensis TaxID=1544730 RepID=UPI00361F0B6D
MSTKYLAVAGRYHETAGYAVSVLQAIANNALIPGETPSEYAQRHLEALAKDGRIRLIDQDPEATA